MYKINNIILISVHICKHTHKANKHPQPQDSSLPPFSSQQQFSEKNYDLNIKSREAQIAELQLQVDLMRRRLFATQILELGSPSLPPPLPLAPLHLFNVRISARAL